MSDEQDQQVYMEAIGRLLAAMAVSDGEDYDAVVAVARDGGLVEYPVVGFDPLVTIRGVDMLGVLMSAVPPPMRPMMLASLAVSSGDDAALVDEASPAPDEEVGRLN